MCMCIYIFFWIVRFNASAILYYQQQKFSNKQPKMSNKKMKVVSTNNTNYGDADYWQERYKATEGQRFDWLQNFQTLKDLVCKHLNFNKQAMILNIGCGNGQIQDHLYEAGYHHIINNDISKAVIEQMETLKQGKKQEKMIYEIMDVRKMTYPDKHFNMVLDKSTIDALCCSEAPIVDVAMMLKEVYRVLKEDGVYFVVSYARPENRLEHLKRDHVSWDIDVQQIERQCEQNGGKMYHYLYVCKKKKMQKEMNQQQYQKYLAELEVYQKQQY